VAVVEDIELRVTVNGLQAQKALDETRVAAEKMGGGASRVIGSLEGLQKGAQALQQRLGPAAAAISGVSSALGATGGQAGQAVAVVGQLAAAFAAGGPLAAALVATTGAVDVLTKSWDEQIRRQDEALKQAFAGVEAAAKSLQTARSAATAAARANMPQEWQQSADAAERLAAAEAKIAAERAKLLTASGRQRALTDEARTNIEASIKLAEAEREQILRLNAEIEKQTRNRKLDAEQAAFDAARQDAENKRLEQARAARAAHNATLEDERRIRAELQIGMMAEEERQLREVAQARREAAKEREAIEAERQKISLSGGMRTGGLAGAPARGVAARPDDELNELRKAAERSALAAQDWSLAWKLASNQVTSALAVTGDEFASFATSAAASLGVFAAEAAAGQQDALQNLLTAASQQAGGFVMLEGGKLIAAGVTSLGLGNPIGAGQIAGGAGLVAAGAAIQAGGPLAVSSLLGQSGGAGAAAASGTAADPGARARPARTMPGEGGGTQLTIVYGGLSGPTADDGARALKKGEQRARKRGY
jgi:hypothetical protein